MIALAAALLLAAAQPASLLAVRVEEGEGSATIALQLSGPATVVTRYWTDRLHTLILDLRGATLAIRPGPAHRSRRLQVRTGQFQARTARVVVESAPPFAYTTKRTQDGLLVQLRFAGAHENRRPSPKAQAPAPVPVPATTRAAAIPPDSAQPSAPAQAAARIFSIVAFGTLDSVAQTVAAIAGTEIRVHPAVARRPAALKLDRATLQQALAELCRQTGARWTRAADGTVEITP